MREFFSLPSSAQIYEALARAIDDLSPRVTPGSTGEDDLRVLLVERRRLWMSMHGLGPQR